MKRRGFLIGLGTIAAGGWLLRPDNQGAPHAAYFQTINRGGPDQVSLLLSTGEFECDPDYAQSLPTPEEQLQAMAELHTALAAGAVPVLVDVRSGFEFSSGHVAGSVNIPLGAIGSAELPDADEVWVICRSGNRSAAAAAQLQARGKRVVDVAGGTTAWSAAGHPLAGRNLLAELAMPAMASLTLGLAPFGETVESDADGSFRLTSSAAVHHAIELFALHPTCGIGAGGVVSLDRGLAFERGVERVSLDVDQALVDRLCRIP